MYHYVYRITNIIKNKHYYGVRKCKILPEKDLGIKYFSSSTDKLFIKDQKENPQNYKYKIIRICNTRREAIELEIKLHNKFNVGINESFYNKCKQTSSGFDNSNLNFFEIAKKEKEKGGYARRANKCKQTWLLKSFDEMQALSEMYKTSFSKIDTVGRAKKSAETRLTTVCDNNKTLQQNTTEKTVKSCTENGWYNELSTIQSERMSKIMNDGRTQAQHRREKQYIKQKEIINEDGLNAAQVAAKKYHENLKNTVDLETGVSKAELRIKRQKETIKKNGSHKGEKNSSFGTTWLYNTELKKNKKVKGEGEIAQHISNGWAKGLKREYFKK